MDRVYGTNDAIARCQAKDSMDRSVRRKLLCRGFSVKVLYILFKRTEDPNCPTVLNTVHAQMDLLPRKGDRLFDENNPSPPRLCF